jgi:hypothetical protein
MSENAKTAAEELSKAMGQVIPGHRLMPEGTTTAPQREGVTKRRRMTERPPAPPVGPFAAALKRWEHAPEVEAIDRLRELAGEVAELRAKLEAIKARQAEAVVDGKDPAKLTAEAVTVLAGTEAREAAIPALEDRIRDELRAHYQGELAALDAAIEEGRGELAKLRAEYETRKAATEETHIQYNRAHGDQRSRTDSRYRLVQKLAAVGDLSV